MSKRQEIRDRRRRTDRRNRILIILLVGLIAVLVVFVLILPGLKGPNVGKIVQITPVARKAAVDKTTMGDPKAPVKMDVWEDFQCSGCLSYSKNLEPQVISTYVDTGKVFYTFHFYPFIDGGSGESHQAANAAMCAAAQGRFWDYHDMLFANWLGENAGSFTNARLVVFAQRLGLDMTAFNACFQVNTYADQIAQDAQAGGKLGVPPTPGIFVNGKMVVSSAGQDYLPSFADISKTIDAALNQH
ncbi:MAG: thioredoxin domain-containing protein [Anaerolineales bacterium]